MYEKYNEDTKQDVEQGESSLESSASQAKSLIDGANKLKDTGTNTSGVFSGGEKAAEAAATKSAETTAEASAGATTTGAEAGAAGSGAGAGAGASVGTIAAVVLIIVLLILGTTTSTSTPSSFIVDEDLQEVSEDGTTYTTNLEPAFLRAKGALLNRYSDSLNNSNTSKTISDGVYEYLKENYEVDLKENELNKSGHLTNGLSLSSNDEIDNLEYKINITATPYMSLDELCRPIALYCIAVNGALYSTTYVDNEFLERLSEDGLNPNTEDMYRYDISSQRYVLKDEWKDAIKKSEYTSSSSEAFEKAIRDFANEHEEVFGIEERYKQWDFENFTYEKNAIYIEEEYEDFVYDEKGKIVRDKNGKALTEKKTRTVPKMKDGEQCYEVVINGSVVIPINYDVSYYKYDKFEEICDLVANEKLKELEGIEYDEEKYNYEYFYDQAFYELDILVRAQYEMSYEAFLTEEVQEKIERVNEKLVNSGVFSDINGLNSANVGALAFFGISGDAYFGEYGYLAYATDGLSQSELINNSKAIWGHVLQVAKKHSYMPIYNGNGGYQCVDFARAWIYDHYGIFPSLGNGQYCAKRLVEEYGDKFMLSSSPSPGAICSIGSTNSNEYGHVLCIDAVNFEEKTITYSEGNNTGIVGGLCICHTVSFQDFYNSHKSTGIVFAVPIS